MTAPVSLIVPTWNRIHELRTCLRLVTALNPKPTEIVIVDNGSSDGTATAIRDANPQVQVVRNTLNRGAAHARNQGLKLATQPFVWFLDTDTSVPRLNTLTNMLDVLQDPNVGAVGGEIIEAPGGHRLKIHRAWPHGAPWVEFVSPEPLDTMYEAAFVSTANCMMRRPDLAAIGGFDPWYFYEGEDSDLGARLAQTGRLSVVSGGTGVVHHLSTVQDRRSLAQRERFRVRRSILYHPWWTLPLLPLLDAASSLALTPRYLRRLASAPAGSVVSLPERCPDGDQRPSLAVRATRLATLYGSALLKAHLVNLRSLRETLVIRRSRPDFLAATPVPVIEQ